MGARPNVREIEPGRGGLGELQVRLRPGQVLGHPLARRQPEPGLAAPRIVRRQLQRLGIGLHGVRDRAEIVQRLALQARQGEQIRGLARHRQAALQQRPGALEAVVAELRLRRSQICASRLRRLRPVQVLGMQYGVAAGEPLGGLAVQLAPSRFSNNS